MFFKTVSLNKNLPQFMIQIVLKKNGFISFCWINNLTHHEMITIAEATIFINRSFSHTTPVFQLRLSHNCIPKLFCFLMLISGHLAQTTFTL